MIKAVFIDYTGTTVQESGPELKEAITRICKNSILHEPKEMVKTWWSLIKSLEEKSYLDTYLTEEQILDKALFVFEKEYALNEDLNVLKDLIRSFWSNAPVFSDAKDFYEKCPLPIYVITNNGSQYVEKALKKACLYPKGIISADAVKAYKPHKELFEYGLLVAGLTPNEVIHIGDSYQSDVLGARAVGIKPVLVQRNGEENCKNDVTVVKSLTECLDFIV